MLLLLNLNFSSVDRLASRISKRILIRWKNALCNLTWISLWFCRTAADLYCKTHWLIRERSLDTACWRDRSVLIDALILLCDLSELFSAHHPITELDGILQVLNCVFWLPVVLHVLGHLQVFFPLLQWFRVKRHLGTDLDKARHFYYLFIHSRALLQLDFVGLHSMGNIF